MFMCVSGVERDDECATVKVRKLIWFKFKSDPSSTERQQTAVATPTCTLLTFIAHIWSNERLIDDFQCPTYKAILNMKHQAVSDLKRSSMAYVSSST